MFDTIIVMAGTGERAGLSYNKNLYVINGKPLFRYSLETFLNTPDCSKVILVVHEKELEIVKKMITGIKGNIELVIGGLRRVDSVRFGMRYAEKDIVLIHDAARPLIKRKSINAVYEAACKNGYAAVGIKATDTIYEETSKGITVLNRADLWHIQTPQAVKRAEYEKLLQSDKYNLEEFSDDIGFVMNALNIKPILVLGDRYNFKVTYEYDLLLLEQLIRRGHYGL